MLGRFAPFGALVALVVLAACGGGGDHGAFDDCGNGVVNSGEECDDGNVSDQDACLSTCQLNVCGDGFVNQGVEQCEPGLLGSETCATRGFAGGTLACSQQCTFDTSRCAGTGGIPTPTATPTAATTGATPANGTATPSTGSTPSGACGAGGSVVVTAALDQAYGGAVVDLVYPTSVRIPGTGSEPSVVARVQFTASGGLPAVNDSDTNGDQVEDTLTAALSSLSNNPAGPFATVTFDCVEGQPAPTTSDFTCMVGSVSTPEGRDITTDTHCALTVSGP